MHIKIENVLNTVRSEWICHGGNFLVELTKFLETRKVIKSTELRQVMDARGYEAQMEKLIQALKKK